MNKKLVSLVVPFVAACAASAQSSGIRLFAGYGWSGSIDRLSAGSRHLLGPELGLDVPISKKSVAEVDFRADVLLGGQLVHGADLDGYVYRFMMMGRTAIPGSSVTTFEGIGWGFAQARAGEFKSFNGLVTQIGISLPFGLKLAGFSPNLEFSTSIASKSGLSGYSIGLALRF